MARKQPERRDEMKGRSLEGVSGETGSGIIKVARRIIAGVVFSGIRELRSYPLMNSMYLTVRLAHFCSLLRTFETIVSSSHLLRSSKISYAG